MGAMALSRDSSIAPMGRSRNQRSCNPRSSQSHTITPLRGDPAASCQWVETGSR